MVKVNFNEGLITRTTMKYFGLQALCSSTELQWHLCSGYHTQDTRKE